jgi:hypothetical protein
MNVKEKCVLLTLFLSLIPLTQAQTLKRLDLGGGFRVLSMAHNGSDQVTLSVALDLVNRSTEDLQLTSVAYLPKMPLVAQARKSIVRAEAQPLATPLVLNAQVRVRNEQQITLSTAEFAQLQRQHALLFLATFTRADGSSQRQTVRLQSEFLGRVK